ncbi:hypothetical protein JHK85_053159 [Glycine max]|uniref:Disease resistance protein RGA2 n=1 Tax=Glycine soja TaxID=3848 RepID=A0A0B2R3X5_GLYSO|nr:hypothetical protein JHK85_053159 [Glycine max]KHN28360.1 Disease resistance protein RGA2 [Glycine soja]
MAEAILGVVVAKLSSRWRRAGTISGDVAHELDDIMDECAYEKPGLEFQGIKFKPGQGGLGKTTLAQLAFNRERVAKHFELRIWVCVSEDFSLKRMTKAIIEAASGCACDDLDLEPLQKKLQDLLQRKRYFLILDDVWNDEQENWQRLKSVLACGAKGASILVTTHLSSVATIMGTTPPHELSMMPKKNCWELFKHRAFGPDEVMQVELEVIGKEIVKKCGGVPLAAKALGSLLCFERKEEAWLNVKENNLWSSSHDIMPALSLNGKLDVEDVGDSVWHELHWRSFFQDLETDELGKLTSLRSLTMYFVGKKRGFRLAELGALKLKGCLHIKHLERVKSVTDAKEANMPSKKLKQLWLSWDLSWAKNHPSELQENFEQILDVLQPHTQQLLTLGMIRYKGVHFPQWISSASLKSLSLNCLPNLIRLSREDGENMSRGLSILEITQCPKLLGLPCLPSINDLRIEGKCNQDFLGSIHKLGSLKSLRFIYNDKLTCFPDEMLQNLTSLKMLEFCRLYKLKVLPTEIINLNAI